MQWVVFAWALFVLAMYVGGYLLPASIGIYTPDSGKIYAVFLLIAVASSALRAVAALERGQASPDANRQP